MFSKVKRNLEKKPPKRTTICTTPRFLMKKRGKVQKKGVKQSSDGEQKGETGSVTVAQQQRGDKKRTKGQGPKKRHEPQAEGKTEKHKKVSQKTGCVTSGVKLKK